MLRLKIGSKRISIDTEKRMLEYSHPVPLREESGLSSAKKRGPQGVVEDQKEKRLKMDCTEKMGCNEKMQCLKKRSITCQKKVSRDGDACLLRTAKEKRLPTWQISKPKVKSDGALSSLDDGGVCSSKPITATPVKDVVSGDGITACLSNVEISPRKALRTAVLTLRYADLICKSQTNNLFNHCDKSVAEKLRQEKELLEQKQLEIKAMAESQIQATEAARQMEAEIESKQQLEKIRQDARTAIENIKKTVEIDIEPEVRDIVDRLTGLSQCTHLLNYNGWSADEEEREAGEILYEEEREEGEILCEEEREEGEGEILYEEEREEGEVLREEEREEGEILCEEEREEGEIF